MENISLQVIESDKYLYVRIRITFPGMLRLILQVVKLIVYLIIYEAGLTQPLFFFSSLLNYFFTNEGLSQFTLQVAFRFLSFGCSSIWHAHMRWWGTTNSLGMLAVSGKKKYRGVVRTMYLLYLGASSLLTTSYWIPWRFFQEEESGKRQSEIINEASHGLWRPTQSA